MVSDFREVIKRKSAERYFQKMIIHEHVDANPSQ
jgi:hypothetical protein